MTVYSFDGSPLIVDDGVWAAIIRLNPLGVSPVDYVSDTLEARLGASLSGGSFTFTAEDPDLAVRNVVSDLQEVWIGAQKGPQETVYDGVSGRKWLTGGWIEKRYTSIDKKGRKIFNSEGFDYMTLMKGLIWGTPDISKDYQDVVLGYIFSQLADYLITLGFIKAEPPNIPDDWFDTTIGPQHLTKTYDAFNMISDIMRDLVDTADPKADWYIRPWVTPSDVEMRLVFFHARGGRTSGMTIDWNNLRSGDFVWGDAKDVVTNVWATDGERIWVPKDNGFCIAKPGWYGKTGGGIFNQILDLFDYEQGTIDQGTNAPVTRDKVWCNQGAVAGIMNYIGGGTQRRICYPATMGLGIDGRLFSHIVFWYRTIPGSPGWICCNLHTGNAWHYMYKYFTSQVSGEIWSLVRMEMPLVGPDGTVLDWKGWTSVLSDPDLTNIKRIEVQRTPGPLGLDYQMIAGLAFTRACFQESASGLYWPPRYLVITDKALDSPTAAYNRAVFELYLRQNPLVYLNPTVDGDPRYLPALNVTLNLVSPFSGVTRVIDEVSHNISEKVDYYCTMSLSEFGKRAPPVFEGGDQDAYSRRMTDLERILEAEAKGRQGYGLPFY